MSQSFCIYDPLNYWVTLTGNVSTGANYVYVTVTSESGTDEGTVKCSDDGYGDLTGTLPSARPLPRALSSLRTLSHFFLFTSSLAHSTAPPYAGTFDFYNFNPGSFTFFDNLGF
jgi:hypothetical protein